MMKRFITCISFLMLTLLCFAQNDKALKAEKIFNFILTSNVDSAYQYLNDNIRKAVTKEALARLSKSLQSSFGTYQGHDECKEVTENDQQSYIILMHYPMKSLAFTLNFDAQGLVGGLWLKPVIKQEKNIETLPASLVEKDITVTTGSFHLPGVITMPKNGTRLPIVVLVHGSGPSDRNETTGANYPLRDLAWGLAQKGVAVLRYDKRTFVYGSKFVGPGEKYNFDSEAVNDAVSAVLLAAKQPGIDAKQIYLLGHSLGAELVPRIALRCQTLKGVIMMAAPARPLADVVLSQCAYLDSIGVQVLSKEEKDYMNRQAQNYKNIDTPAYDKKIGLPLDMPLSYCRDAKNYDQVAAALRLKIPMLIMQGKRDYQVQMIDFNLWKSKLGTPKRIEYKSYDKLNHLFMEGIGVPSPVEYETPNHIPAYVIDDIADFVKRQK